MDLCQGYPLRVTYYSGHDCVSEHADALCLGHHAMIVTGRHSAARSGALDDVRAILKERDIDFDLFDEITENPPVSVCHAGGAAAREVGADFVIGIGGGSPMDAAKAIAAFAANPDLLEPTELFDAPELAPSLPLVLIPTTAGTGSEANPYAVLTLDGEMKKKTFNRNSYAQVAFLDGAYTKSQSESGMLSCALDAFCHCFESYLSPKATEASRAFALTGARVIWNAFADGWSEVDDETRQDLLMASFYGGAAIEITGTGFPHPMGYNFTLDRGVPHGRACALFTEAYVDVCRRSEEGVRRLEAFCSHLGTDPDTVALTLPALARLGLEADLILTRDDVAVYCDRIRTARNFANCVNAIGEEEIRRIYSEMFENTSVEVE